MSEMTWKEFKKHVEAQLEEKGISKDAKIWYIDISFPSTSGYKLPDVNHDDPDNDFGIAID